MPEPEATAITGSITSSLVLAADEPAALDLGATSEDPPRQESFGAEAWLLDPEANRLLLLVLP
jgi:hypothetical protein